MSERETPSLLQILKGLKHTDLLTALITPSIKLNFLASRNTIVPTHSGLIVDREEWEEIKREIDGFYKFFSDDAVRLVNERAKRIGDGGEAVIDLSVVRRKGYVLLLKSADNLYRVGLCSNLTARLREIQRGGLYTIVHNYKTGDMRRDEVMWASRFDRYRVNGSEWLKLPDAELQAFLSFEPLTEKEEKSDAANKLNQRKGVYWGKLTALLKSIPAHQKPKEATSIASLIKLVDKNDWTDDDVFSCLQYVHDDKKFNGLISYSTILNYMPSYMARLAKNGKGKEGAKSAGDNSTGFANNSEDHI